MFLHHKFRAKKIIYSAIILLGIILNCCKSLVPMYTATPSYLRSSSFISPTRRKITNNNACSLSHRISDVSLFSFLFKGDDKNSSIPVAILSLALLISIIPSIALSEITIKSNEQPFQSEISTTRHEAIQQAERLLTSPLLEKYRILNQLDDDTNTQFTSKTLLLIPIIQILQDLDTVHRIITPGTSGSETYEINVPLYIDALQHAKDILSNEKYEKKIFKKIFNRYSDNIYYADPSRANMYLAGGAMPGTIQTQQYLYRNLALTTIENTKEDIEMVLTSLSMKDKNREGSVVDKVVIDDMIDDCNDVLEAMNNYLLLADPEDLKAAKAIVFENKK